MNFAGFSLGFEAKQALAPISIFFEFPIMMASSSHKISHLHSLKVVLLRVSFTIEQDSVNIFICAEAA